MAERMTEQLFTTTTRGNGPRAYHRDPDCLRLEQSTVVERSREYVEWHQLRPCDRCTHAGRQRADTDRTALTEHPYGHLAVEADGGGGA